MQAAAAAPIRTTHKDGPRGGDILGMGGRRVSLPSTAIRYIRGGDHNKIYSFSSKAVAGGGPTSEKQDSKVTVLFLFMSEVETRVLSCFLRTGGLFFKEAARGGKGGERGACIICLQNANCFFLASFLSIHRSIQPAHSLLYSTTVRASPSSIHTRQKVQKNHQASIYRDSRLMTLDNARSLLSFR